MSYSYNRALQDRVEVLETTIEHLLSYFDTTSFPATTTYIDLNGEEQTVELPDDLSNALDDAELTASNTLYPEDYDDVID